MKYSIIILLFCTACHSARRVNNATTETVFNDSAARVYSLEENSNKELSYFITADGKKVLLKKYTGPQDIPPPPAPPIRREDSIRMDAPVMPMAAAAPRAFAADDNDPFTGSVRSIPKTTYSTKKYEKFRTIPALFRKLPSSENMKALGIGRRNERVPEEDRNVRIEKAYLYTVTVEADNDLHLLIGNTPVYIPGETRVFNAEISGIPPDGTAEEKEQMRRLRAKAIAAMLDIPLCGRNNYLQVNRRISIRGSLFFDSHHASKPARCREVEGESAWEIHPVKDIVFD